ncbi:hypothetical protein C2S53_019839 [Perilla frutescens var. hirtella]|uniref:Pectinesterase inhibitor domain-containing protein n=1 Tax=Perilla frutescens var. hirtella TaxID=608512 RepID=A0AAD4P4V8_PERFH|nr:hypothetical protein C2S53_019839 [Perilla frutescens var. hirtella]
MNMLLVLLLSCLHYLHYSAADPNPNATKFIETECRATLYPVLCIQSLRSYSSIVQNSPKQLARVALSASLSRAQSVSSFISKVARMRGLKEIEYVAVKDCVANMGSTVDQLSRSVKEVGAMKHYELNWHQSNIESWVGAAITFQQTCLDGFSSPIMDGNIKIAVSKRILDCSHVTSNALVLIHRYAKGAASAGTHGSTNLP